MPPLKKLTEPVAPVVTVAVSVKLCPCAGEKFELVSDVLLAVEPVGQNWIIGKRSGTPSPLVSPPAVV